MPLNLIKRDPAIIKNVIFEIAKNNGATLSDIGKNTKLNYQTIKNQVVFLFNSGLLELGKTEKDIKRGKGFQPGDSIKSVKFNSTIQTFQQLAKILDNKELSKFMETKYYQDNVKEYLINLINSIEQNKLYRLPDSDYLEYALRNSPSTVRFFLIDNDINLLKSFHKRCISLSNENLKKLISNKSLEDTIKPELIDKFVYPFWDQTIFGKIQEDALNNILLNPNDYFANYFPTFKNAVNMLEEITNIPETKKFLKLLRDKSRSGRVKLY